jgi:hypothetical protein
VFEEFEKGSTEYIEQVIEFVKSDDCEYNRKLASVKARNSVLLLISWLLVLTFSIGGFLFVGHAIIFSLFVGSMFAATLLASVWLYPKKLRHYYTGFCTKDNEAVDSDQLDWLKEYAVEYPIFKTVLQEFLKQHKDPITYLMYSRLSDYADSLETQSTYEQFVADINSDS